jgi:hypothetical protein
LQFVFEVFEVTLDRRTQIGIQNRGIGAGVLPGNLRQRAAKGPVNFPVWIRFCSKRANFFFVAWIDPGVHQAHGDSLDFFIFD